jgi:hypothetical protein
MKYVGKKARAGGKWITCEFGGQRGNTREERGRRGKMREGIPDCACGNLNGFPGSWNSWIEDCRAVKEGRAVCVREREREKEEQ